ncbi:MAG: ATP-binding protein [Paludibacteraceae bacterium]|nr:ATP-binding protein [Paludibacteraceae bacterium]
MEFQRKQFNIVLSRIKEPRGKIQVVVGPRQVGKSTLMDQVLAQCPIPYSLAKADNVDSNDPNWIKRVWESARGTMTVKKETEHLLVIDEIQKITNWSEAVKEEWDWDCTNKLQLKVVLLGSSRLMIQSGLSESLAGRFELIRMGHWSLTEMQDAFGFSLDQYMYFGGYPGAAQFVHDETRWKRYIKDSIITPAVEKDIKLTTNIYKPVLMKRLFHLSCNYSAMELSLTKMLGQLQDAGNVTTLANYLGILEQCQLVCGLQKYANDEARKYNSSPKYQVFNNALLTANQRGKFETIRSDSELWGRWVESAIGAHLLNSAEEQDYQVFYWRERNDEVDYIVATDDGCVAFEVKSGRRKMNSGMKEFEKAFKPVHSYIIGTGGISFEDFLKTDVTEWIG